MDLHFDVVECQYGGRQTFHMPVPLALGAVHLSSADSLDGCF